MVGTTHPGNLGAAARAMGNMGVDRLLLARPEARLDDATAQARATSSHAGILAKAEVHPALDAALRKQRHAYAFTIRRRELSVPSLELRPAARRIARQLAAGRDVALVFGAEQAGLSNDEVDLCDAIATIPLARERGSLNVAAAVQLACYECMLARGAAAVRPAKDDPPASKGEIIDLLAHMREVLKDYPVRHQGLRSRMMRRLAVLINRAQPQSADVSMLRGFLTRIDKQRQRDKSSKP